MRKIISNVFSSDIAPYIAFKGGTLAYFCYNLDRYSTDIDIDLLDNEQEEYVLEVISELLDNLGDVKSLLVGKHLHRRKFRYDLQSTNIKVELNKRVSPHNVYEYQTIENTQVLSMDRTSSATNKLLALTERYYNRDLYDTHFYLKNNYCYNLTIIEERTGKNIRQLIQEIITQLPKKYPENLILSGMGDILTDKQKARVKANLVNETIYLLTLYLENH